MRSVIYSNHSSALLRGPPTRLTALDSGLRLPGKPSIDITARSRHETSRAEDSRSPCVCRADRALHPNLLKTSLPSLHCSCLAGGLVRVHAGVVPEFTSRPRKTWSKHLSIGESFMKKAAAVLALCLSTTISDSLSAQASADAPAAPSMTALTDTGWPRI